jgi:hypothetical protein
MGAHSKMKGLLRQHDSHNMYQRILEVTEAKNNDLLKIAMMYIYFMSQEKKTKLERVHSIMWKT